MSVPRKPNKKGRITEKRVQATENDRPPIPAVEAKPENDDADERDGDGFTMRQRLFVEAITSSCMGNATAAAKAAGYCENNNSGLRTTACRLLAKANIQEAIAHSLARRRLTPEWTRNQVVDIASASLTNFITVGDDGEPTVDWAKAAAAGAIGHLSEIKEEGLSSGGSGGKVDIIKRTFKLHNRLKALELLARMQNLVNPEPAAPEERNIVLRPIVRAGLQDANADRN